MNCNICPRKCNKDRKAGNTGFCGLSNEIKIARAALHFWEEPCISGISGSGAVFFSGCNLRCIFCQNHSISSDRDGLYISVHRLSEIFLELQNKGAANINLVTPTHYIYEIIDAVNLARKNGLVIPIVYNTSGYELAESVKALKNVVDIFLPDFKYADGILAGKLSAASDYPKIAIESIGTMLDLVGKPLFENNMMKKGVIVRHLVLPGHVHNSMDAIRMIYENFGDDVYISIMNQYTPIDGLDIPDEFSELKRKVTKREYEKVLSYALNLGIKNGFFQEDGTDKESFIPPFDYEGVLKQD